MFRYFKKNCKGYVKFDQPQVSRTSVDNPILGDVFRTAWACRGPRSGSWPAPSQGSPKPSKFYSPQGTHAASGAITRPTGNSHPAVSSCLPAIHEFPADLFSNKERQHGAVLLHILGVSGPGGMGCFYTTGRRSVSAEHGRAGVCQRCPVLVRRYLGEQALDPF